jgi:hypothetical protein
MVTRQQIDGSGAVFVDDTGAVRIFLSDACAEAFDAAAERGISADQLVDAILIAAASETGHVGTDPHFVDRRDVEIARTGHRTTSGHGPCVDRCARSQRPKHRARWRKRYS